MTDEQKRHLQEIQQAFTHAVEQKYRKGQEEHGGNLWEKPMDREIWAEAIDLVTYAQTLCDQHARIRLICADAINGRRTPEEAIRAVFQIIGGKLP